MKVPWWKRRRTMPKMRPEQVDDPDPMMRHTVAESYNTGKGMVSVRNEDGTWTTRPIDG